MKFQRKKLLPVFSLLICFGFILSVSAAVVDHVRGYILLQVEENGEAWYVDPSTNLRYYLGRPADAFAVMRERGLGISNADLAKIPINGTSWDADVTVLARVKGRILLQVEENGEAWYVYPKNGKRYYLGRPKDAFRIMRKLGLGITNADLFTIPDTDNQSTGGSGETEYTRQTISTERGAFTIDLVKIPRNSFQMVTDTGNETDCSNNCAAKSLADYIGEHGAVAGIHGTYFCPPDYSSCSGQINTFLPPVYNTNAGVMINQEKLPFHSGPMIAVTTDNTFYYFHRTKDFGYTVEEFEERTGKKLKSAMANYPSLIEGGKNIVSSEPLDSKQQTQGARGGIGYNTTDVFLVIASSASVEDLAAIFDALNADYAMNLDGGGSVALYTNGLYVVGPGRALPNAIIFQSR